MTLSPAMRRLALTAHITASVGWLGAVAGFLALAVVGLDTADPGRAGAAYLSMEVFGWGVIVPLSVASLVTGLVQSLGTPWGLFRHRWVVTKLLLTVGATIVLLVHMQPIGYMARLAAEMAVTGDDLRRIRVQLVADAVAALVVLLVATVLSVYKPWGLTRYGRRKQKEARGATSS